jgi:hypothetical protein
MAERQHYTMTQADYDELIEKIAAARKVSGMFLSGGQPLGDVQATANDAWCALGKRMGFEGMSVEPAGSPLTFTAIPIEAKPQEQPVEDVSPKRPIPEPEHLGDGVYASFDGYQIWLAANHHENRVVALEPGVMAQLIGYAQRAGMISR